MNPQYNDDGDQVLLDSSAAFQPAVTKTWFLSLLAGLAAKATGKAPKVEDIKKDDNEISDDEASSSDAPGSGTSTPGGGKVTYAATTKAGGKRRKVVKRK